MVNLQVLKQRTKKGLSFLKKIVKESTQDFKIGLGKVNLQNIPLVLFLSGVTSIWPQSWMNNMGLVLAHYHRCVRFQISGDTDRFFFPGIKWNEHMMKAGSRTFYKSQTLTTDQN